MGDFPAQLGVGLLEREVGGFQTLLVVPTGKLSARSHGEDPDDLEIDFTPIAFPPIQYGQVPLDLAVLVAQWNGEEAVCPNALEPLAILGKHLLDIAGKGDDLVIEDTFTRRAGEVVLERLAEFSIAPIRKRPRLVGLARDLGDECAARIQRLGE